MALFFVRRLTILRMLQQQSTIRSYFSIEHNKTKLAFDVFLNLIVIFLVITIVRQHANDFSCFLYCNVVKILFPMFLIYMFVMEFYLCNLRYLKLNNFTPVFI